MQLSGKVALITGGRRVGGELALLLAERGMHIAMTYHTSSLRIENTVAQCRARGVSAQAFSADLREARSAQKMVDDVVRRFGRIDVLVNLTSIYQATPFDELKPEHYEAMISSNLTAPYWVAVAVGQQMKSQAVVEGLQGKIIHFTDWSVDRPYRGYLPYLIGKGGVVTLTKALAVELAPTITVNAIAPGTIEPPPDATPELLEKIEQASALRRVGSPDDVNRAVLYLLEGTDFVTGEIFRIDGGRFLGPPEASASGGA